MWKKVSVVNWLCFFAVLIMSSCTSAPDIQPETKPETIPLPPPPSPNFVMKPYHEAMNAEMRISFERADEILIGLYTGSHEDEQFGLIHYFDDFKSFDKTSLSWGQSMIIKRNEFKQLSDLDKVGICWDPYEQTRNVYLCEGQKMLIFLQTGYDEANNRSYRNIIDAYPVTPDCRADEVFDTLFK